MSSLGRWVNEEGVVSAPRAHNNLPESLDYEALENDVYRGEHYHHPSRRHFYGCVARLPASAAGRPERATTPVPPHGVTVVDADTERSLASSVSHTPLCCTNSFLASSQTSF